MQSAQLVYDLITKYDDKIDHWKWLSTMPFNAFGKN